MPTTWPTDSIAFMLKADSAGLVGARLMLVDGVRITLRNALSLLGIEAPERM
jgi:arginyl-tRNA synthetase